MTEVPLWQYAVGAYFLYVSVLHWSTLRELPNIPTFGHSGFFSSWKTAFDFIIGSPDVIQKGYDLHRGVAFKIWTFSGWLVMVSGRSMVEDVRRARDEELSFTQIVEEVLSFHLEAPYPNPNGLDLPISNFNQNTPCISIPPTSLSEFYDPCYFSLLTLTPTVFIILTSCAPHSLGTLALVLTGCTTKSRPLSAT